MIIMIQPVDASTAAAIIHAVVGIVPSDSITLLEKTLLPMEGERPENEIPTVDEDLARACAAAIRPKQGQEARAEWLVDVFCTGTNSFWQQGEPAISEQSPTRNRAVSAGVSRALKAIFPHLASPIDMLVTRRRTYFPNGAYEGIQYIPTALGSRVYEILKDEGAFR